MRYHLCSIRRMAAGDDRYWDAEVTSVEVTHHWRLRLEFSDGYSGEVDVSYLRRKPGLFKDLSDPDYFARAFLDEEQGTVAWPNGMDVAAHVLRGRADQQGRRPPSARRGKYGGAAPWLAQPAEALRTSMGSAMAPRSMQSSYSERTSVTHPPPGHAAQARERAGYYA
jgi:hypothetical protein